MLRRTLLERTFRYRFEFPLWKKTRDLRRSHRSSPKARGGWDEIFNRGTESRALAVTYGERYFLSGNHIELSIRKGCTAQRERQKTANDPDGRKTHDFAYVLRGARFDHARRVLLTGCSIMVFSYVIRGVACPYMSSFRQRDCHPCLPG